MSYEYVKKFEKLGFGLFVHFGVYSVLGKGEWSKSILNIPDAEYEKLIKRFKVNKNWAGELVKTAKEAGAKYVTLTTRHHDGFSLYDTCGLNEYDAPHSACGRDLIKEFVEVCNEGGVVPFFYHTGLDWHNPDYKNNFPAYIDYLVKSIEILCTKYGKVGGFWFDGKWDKPNADWQEDRLYKTIRTYQPEAMIINNTGLSELGKVEHREIDSVTFERGKPCRTDSEDRPRAGEMCQVLNDHWGYAKEDCNYKSVKELIENLVDCRSNDCNFLLNTGLKGNGSVNETDGRLLREIGKWLKANKSFIYEAKAMKENSGGAIMLQGEKCCYAVIKDVPMSADPNVTLTSEENRRIILPQGMKIEKAEWLDNGKRIKITENTFFVEPFEYGRSYSARVAKLEIKNERNV